MHRHKIRNDADSNAMKIKQRRTLRENLNIKTCYSSSWLACWYLSHSGYGLLDSRNSFCGSSCCLAFGHFQASAIPDPRRTHSRNRRPEAEDIGFPDSGAPVVGGMK